MKIIEMEDHPNMRDLGGKYKKLTLKEGMLLRGRKLLKLTPQQQKDLVEVYHVRTIIDLRSHDEQDKEPDQVIEGTRFIDIPVFEREKKGISHTQDEKFNRYSKYRSIPTMDKNYTDMLHGESLKNLAKTIQTIVKADEEDYGFYFHCSEGKDRTGLVSAILLLILGVSRKEAMKEYLITNKTNKKKAFRYYMDIKYRHFQPLFALKVGRIFLAKKQYLQILFDVIDDEFGSDDAFFHEAMGLTDEDIFRFKKIMIVE